ncbi:MAG TPA: iron donor protein CyaY [Sutterella sp.]|nr:iron donor protein CyaY [Sutterella sp.]
MPQAETAETMIAAATQYKNFFIKIFLMTETEFLLKAQETFNALQNALEDVGCEADILGHVLDVILPDESHIVINIQAPMQEIWVALKASGKHFRLENDRWTDTRSGQTLEAVLAEALNKVGIRNVTFS